MNNRDSGVVFLADLVNMADPGNMPEYQLEKIAKNWYLERTVGFRRQYAAKGVNEQVDMLIQTAYQPKARIGKYAILGNGDQFRITNVTPVRSDETGLRLTEWTLTRLEDLYEIADE